MAYEVRISDWSSDVCSSDLFWFQLARWIDSTILDALHGWGFGWNRPHTNFDPLVGLNNAFGDMLLMFVTGTMFLVLPTFWRSEEHTSELQSLMRISYAVFCLKKKKTNISISHNHKPT